MCFPKSKTTRRTWLVKDRVNEEQRSSSRYHGSHRYDHGHIPGGRYHCHGRSEMPRHVDSRMATTVYRRVSVPGAPLALAAYPASTAYVATAAATSTETKGTVAAATTTTTTTTVPAHVAYVHAAATPTRLPEAYHTANYSTRLKAVPAVPTVEDIRLENRRVATERGAYKARPIKPADALPDDMFWCREKDGEWHCRPYYQIENECYPGRWKMDAEHGFLVFHRE